MTLQIDGLLPSQRPIADQDIAKQWGDAVEADIRALDTRVGSVGVAGGSGNVVGYGSYAGNDTAWSGVKNNCAVYPLDGYLYPNNTTTFDSGLLYDAGETYDHWVTSWNYRTLPFVFNAQYNMAGSFTVAGTFPHGNPVITAEKSMDGGLSWSALAGTQAGLTFTFAITAMNAVRFTATVPQASTGMPSFLTNFSMAFTGGAYGENHVYDIPIGGLAVVYSLPFPVAPGAVFTPFFQGGQRLRADITALTATGCNIQLVTDDGVFTPMNGRGLLIVSLG